MNLEAASSSRGGPHPNRSNPPLPASRGAGEFAHSSHPRVIVEHGDAPDMFSNPQDRRTSDCVTGDFG
ncbi:MAG TPA: hypothetical protein VF163_08885 [Micromonosporaceae bacterium]